MQIVRVTEQVIYRATTHCTRTRLWGMAKLIKTNSDTLSLVLRWQFVNEWEAETAYALEREVPEPPQMEESEE